MTDFTQLLQRAGDGDALAEERVAGLLYDELRALARRELVKERVQHTLQPTALVHEAWLRLAGGGQPQFENRAHFWGAAARAIRRVLVEHARRRGRRKRGGALERLELDPELLPAGERDERVLALDDALQRLAELDPGQARLVELRFFAGMTLDEVAQVLGVSPSTVVRDWRLARAWLQDKLEDGDGRT